MTSSSSPPLQYGLDTMILVYSLLQGHPAATACEQLLRAHAGWFTSPWVLFEAHVPPKGLPRVLRRVQLWLSHSHPQAAQDFWSQTGGGSHLP
jgi:hypothetical protein